MLIRRAAALPDAACIMMFAVYDDVMIWRRRARRCFSDMPLLIPLSLRMSVATLPLI